ncbi:hypothetical protein ACFO3J_24285 [Streptomyces polygonati]|uniref:Uncharacterized protein n=1 Tax=Streptomyces polygonati TaxID=1617087 RepID=A0ABV8HUI8_9ACTN
MTKQLTTQNATITTASVEVKTLTISGKQVTLAVFRQLREENVLHPLNATVDGDLWGTVNYHPDRCADAPEHLHVVWQKGSELRRAHIPAPSHAAFRHLYAGLHVEALIADGLGPGDIRTKAGPQCIQVVGNNRPGTTGFARFTHRGVHFHGPVRSEFIDAYYRREKLPTDELWGRIRHVAGPEATAETIADKLPAFAYTEAWRQLRALPQLFIAV